MDMNASVHVRGAWLAFNTARGLWSRGMLVAVPAVAVIQKQGTRQRQRGKEATSGRTWSPNRRWLCASGSRGTMRDRVTFSRPPSGKTRPRRSCWSWT